MLFLERLEAYLKGLEACMKGGHLIRLDGEVQEGGYLYIRSNDLKGFTLMLEPDEFKDLGSLVQAIEEPLLSYASIYFTAKEEARAKANAQAKDEKSRFEVIDFSKKSKTSFSALLGAGLNHC